MNRPQPVFPPSSDALDEPNGLLAMGGDLSVARLLAAYRRGIFPWFEPGEQILWWTPDPRMVLFPSEFHCSKSLRKLLKQNVFQIKMNTRFETVMRACAAPRADEAGTWISEDMVAAYGALHRLGYAHSFECYCDNTLVGGLYGVRIGDTFFGESMFSRVPNASKAAFAALVWMAVSDQLTLIDCQVASPHLSSLGAREISRDRFEELITAAARDNIGGATAGAEPETPLALAWQCSLPLKTEALL